MKIVNNNYKPSYGINFKNVYLDNNRVITAKKVNRSIQRISRSAKITEIKDYIMKIIKRIFNK